VAHGVGRAESLEGGRELARVGRRLGRVEILGSDQLVVRREQPQLEAARAGVDDEDSQ
jgi:hypothetical protein